MNYANLSLAYIYRPLEFPQAIEKYKLQLIMTKKICSVLKNLFLKEIDWELFNFRKSMKITIILVKLKGKPLQLINKYFRFSIEFIKKAPLNMKKETKTS